MIRTTRVICFFVIISVSYPTALLANEGWKLIEDDEGVAVYVRQLEGDSASQFKGVCVVNRPIEIVAAILADIAAYPEWFYKCIEAKKIPKNDSTDLDFIIYMAIKAPWPLLDRDALFHVKTAIDYDSEKVTINSVALKEPLVPIQEDYVRITDAEQQWILEKNTAKATRVIFTNRTDAGGSVSSFISGLGSRKSVYHSLINMKEIAHDPKFKKLGRELEYRFKPKTERP